ncbi:MAG: TonB-dependent receptor [Saprospiraceae bacterium]
MKYIRLTIAFVVLFCSGASAQNLLDTKVDFQVSQVNLETALVELSQQSKINVSFSNDLIPTITDINFSKKNTSIRSILAILLKDTKLDFKVIGKQIVLFRKIEKKTYTINGFIQDKESGEKLIGANIYTSTISQGTSSNSYGFYSITLLEGKQELNFSYLGYQTIVRSLHLTQNLNLNITLSPSLTLAEIVVRANDALQASNPTDLVEDNLPLDVLKKLPSLGGEPDVLRMAQLLPGIQSGADGIGGIHVRGGNADQNLILLDGVPVYNPLHAIGAFSIFNADAIKSARLFKGNFPARYGGRLSSVFDIRTKEGNQKKYSVKAGIGITAAKILVEGPIVKNKSSFLITARRSLINTFTQPFAQRLKEKKLETGNINYFFYDINAKINYAITSKDHLYLSVYQGKDVFEDETQRNVNFNDFITFQDTLEQNLTWGNTIASLRWNHLFSNKLFANTSFTFSKFNFESRNFSDLKDILDNDILQWQLVQLAQYSSQIQDYSGKIDFDWIPSIKHYIRFGLSLSRQEFKPSASLFNTTNTIVLDTLLLEFNNALANSSSSVSYQYSSYLEDEYKVASWLTLNYGVHLAGLQTDGKSYLNFQPRLSIAMQFRKRWQVNLSYSAMTQYFHLLTSSNIGLPSDLWVPSTDKIGPQQTNLYELGFRYRIANGWYFSADSYYKQLDNIIAYQEGTSLLTLNAENWENKVTNGKGTAYGVECALEKTTGTTTGWINYTLSWAIRDFEDINFGEPYPFRYDRRHNLKAGINHQFTHWLSTSATWVYGTGLATTLPTGKYLFDNTPIYTYDAKNGFRMPNYHRLDLGLNMQITKSWATHYINAGIYNVYNKQNPLYYRLRRNLQNSQLSFVQVNLLPIIPYLGYSIKL